VSLVDDVFLFSYPLKVEVIALYLSIRLRRKRARLEVRGVLYGDQVIMIIWPMAPIIDDCTRKTRVIASWLVGPSDCLGSGGLVIKKDKL